MNYSKLLNIIINFSINGNQDIVNYYACWKLLININI